MNDLTLKTPDQLTQVVESLVLSATAKFDLNRRMANRVRQFFRAQMRDQRDIGNTPYRSRTPRKVTVFTQGVRGKHGKKHQTQKVALNTVNNRNMLIGLSRSLRAQVDAESFEIGLTGVAGRIGKQHNDGSQLSFTTRVNGYYNPDNSRWEGGTKVKQNYKMPQRTFIGWTPALERELLSMAAEHFTTDVGS
ncbi:MAG: phage virion morphogenesis protein [Vibrio sp.]